MPHITENQNPEFYIKEKLVASEIRYRRLFESAKDGILILDAETGKIVDVNPFLIELLGYSKESFIKKTIWEIGFFNNIIQNKEKFLELQQKEYVRYEDLPLETTDGRKIHVEFVSNIYLEGSQKVIQCNIRDFTEHKRTEEVLLQKTALLEAQVNSSIDGIIIVDNQGKKILQNQRTIDLWKIPQHIADNKDDHLQVQHVMQMTKNPEMFVRKITDLYENPDVNSFDDVELVDGTVLERYSAPVLDKYGQNYGRIWIFHDITERKYAEEEIKNRNEQLIKLNAEKDKFFSIIAHDLKGPFNGFLNLTELMADSAEVFSHAEIIENSKLLNEAARSLYKLLENLLEWAQVQKGAINFTPKDSDLSKMVSESIETIFQRALQKRISIINEIVHAQKVYADEKMISTVLRNLLSNAVKFTRTDGKAIIKSGWLDNDTIEVSVEDNGVGISEKDVIKLFKIEEKVSSKGTDGESSTGLGLLLCKEFIEMHGGKIWVESQEGKGSKFKFTLHKSILTP